MTDREKAIVMAYTGIAMLTGDKLEVFYKYVESLVKRPVYTHEFASIDLKALSKKDFLDLCAKEERPHGEWISLDDNLGVQRFKCSNCGHQIFCEHSKISQYKGCYCGAKMDNLQSGGGE